MFSLCCLLLSVSDIFTSLNSCAWLSSFLSYIFYHSDQLIFYFNKTEIVARFIHCMKLRTPKKWKTRMAAWWNYPHLPMPSTQNSITQMLPTSSKSTVQATQSLLQTHNTRAVTKRWSPIHTRRSIIQGIKVGVYFHKVWGIMLRKCWKDTIARY